MERKSDFEKMLEEIIAAEEKSIKDYEDHKCTPKGNVIPDSLIVAVKEEIPKMKAALEAYRKAGK